MVDIGKIMDSLLEQVNESLKDLKKAKNVEEKLQYSNLIKNLCDSFMTFLDLIHELTYEYEEDEEEIE